MEVSDKDSILSAIQAVLNRLAKAMRVKVDFWIVSGKARDVLNIVERGWRERYGSAPDAASLPTTRRIAATAPDVPIKFATLAFPLPKSAPYIPQSVRDDCASLMLLYLNPLAINYAELSWPEDEAHHIILTSGGGN